MRTDKNGLWTRYSLAMQNGLSFFFLLGWWVECRKLQTEPMGLEKVLGTRGAIKRSSSSAIANRDSTLPF